MSLIVGITGGIGSGKTTVAEFFRTLGIPVYNADEEAKKLMNGAKIKDQIIELLGDESYTDQGLNRDFIRSQVFKDDDIRLKINEIVHPEVGKHFKKWVSRTHAPYIIKEAAIIFEAGLSHQYDYIITVYADKDLRIKRLLERPGLNRSMIISIMDKQWTDEQKIAQSDFAIKNNKLAEAQLAVEKIHRQLLQISENI